LRFSSSGALAAWAQSPATAALPGSDGKINRKAASRRMTLNAGHDHGPDLQQRLRPARSAVARISRRMIYEHANA
jgi:hypothetical protein